MAAKQIPWQSILDLFTDEIKSEKHSSLWSEFQALNDEDQIIKLIYNFDVFRYDFDD